MRRSLVLAAVVSLAACSAPARVETVATPVTSEDPASYIVETTAPSTTTVPARPVGSPRASRRAPGAGTPTSARSPIQPTGDVWWALGNCESGNNPRAVGGGGRFFGAFQFMLSTWRSVGETGNPVDYSYEHQLAAAKRLQARSGWGQWPHCSRKLGLR